jgi:hypothetical protein
LPLLGPLSPRADLHRPFHPVDGGEDRETIGGADAGNIGIGSAPQAAPGRKKGDRLHQIGFARAVLAGQHHMALVEVERQRCIVAEVAQFQACEKDLVGHCGSEFDVAVR